MPVTNSPTEPSVAAFGDSTVWRRQGFLTRGDRLHVAARHETGDCVPPYVGDQSLYRLLRLARVPPGPPARARKGRDLGRCTGLCGVPVGPFAPAPVLVR